MVSMFGTALPSLIVFPQERPVFLREFSTNHYTTVAYFMSRLVVEGSLTAIQMFLLALVSYFMMQFQLGFGWHYLIIYSLAMTSTAIAVMIGSGVHDAGSAIEFLPMVFVPQILFAGFFIKPSIIPVWLRWLQYVMPLTYGVKLHVEKNFNRNCGSPLGDVNCQKLLSNLNVVASDVWWYWVVMLSLFVVFRCTGLFLLRRKANTFF
jgi:ABC-type multidrug transport system permease subunit